MSIMIIIGAYGILDFGNDDLHYGNYFIDVL